MFACLYYISILDYHQRKLDKKFVYHEYIPGEIQTFLVIGIEFVFVAANFRYHYSYLKFLLRFHIMSIKSREAKIWAKPVRNIFLFFIF